jgi:exonuclease SbcC
LTLRAFGPFAGEESIEFDELAAAGLFTISGKTGAGKSSILDAICFALYGKLPDEREVLGVRSHHASPMIETVVEFEFSMRGSTYRITRTPEQMRGAKRGDKLTKAAHKATLAQCRDGAWQPMASSIAEVKQVVESVVGLDAAQFQQVVLIPQGRFHEALMATPEDRRRLLSKLFGSSRFLRATEQLTARASALQTELRTRESQQGELERARERVWEKLTGTTEWPESARAVTAVVTATRDQAEAGLDRARRADNDARAVLTSAEQRLLRYEEIVSARMERSALDANEIEIAASRSRIALAGAAAPLAPVIRASLGAEAAFETAVSALSRAIDEARRAFDYLPAVWSVDVASSHPWDIGADPAPIASCLERAAGAAARLAETAALVATNEDELARAGAEAERWLEEAAAARRVADDAREVCGELEQQLLARRDAIARLPGLVAAHEVAEKNLRAWEQRATLIERRAAAVDAVQAAQSAAHAASDAYTRAWASRLEHVVGDLARALVPGEACTVCGSVEHPAPAQAVDAQAPDLDVEAAKSARDAMEAQLRAHADALADLDRQIGALETTGATLAASSAALTVAEAARDEAQTRFGATIETEDALLAARGQIEAAQARAAECYVQFRVAQTRSEQLSLEWAAASGELAVAVDAGIDPSRAAAVVETAERATEQWNKARIDRMSAAGARAAALATERDLLTLQGFATRAAAAAAELSAEVVTELTRVAADHDAARVRTDAVLDAVGDDEVDEKVSVDEERQQARATATALESAVEQHALVRDAVGELQRVERLHAGLGEELEPMRREARRVDDLARVCRGDNQMKMPLESYVLAAYLEEIVDAASDRFRAMTMDRYTLRHSDVPVSGNARSGLDLKVFDAYTGREREVRTLSGGETFQASLALALAMADVVRRYQGGLELECLFVDEGFASLDAEVLDLALGELDGLRAGGRMVGVISHLREVGERIPTGVDVIAAPGA